MRALVSAAAMLALAACSGGGGSPSSLATPAPATTTSAAPTPMATASQNPETPGATAPPTAMPTATPGSPGATATPAAGASPLDARLLLPAGFYGNTIAQIPEARQLAPLPNGDLIVGTSGTSIYLIPQAEAGGAAGNPTRFATLPQGPAQGVTYSAAASAIYVATNQYVYKIAYRTGDQVASSSPVQIAAVRTGSVAPNSDGDVHVTTSVLAVGNALYVGVGSSCNACAETDPTRAVVMTTSLSGGALTTVATRVRNPIALTVNPASGHVWIGGAGQDCLQLGTTTCGSQLDNYQNGHPYEWVDDLTAHGSGVTDYEWPNCEEDRESRNVFNSAFPVSDCSAAPLPAVEFPAFGTHIGAAYYPAGQTGAYAFPAAYSGLYVSVHGSWHENSLGIPVTPPNVAFVPMSAPGGDTPKTPVNWNNPTAQWSTFLQGFQDQGGNRIGRPTGLAVGPAGSLFVAEDQNGYVYRIRYGTAPASSRMRR